MALWLEWFRCVLELRPACSRGRTFLWMGLALLGLSVRVELAGVTSFVRALGLAPHSYPKLLHLFHSPGVDLERLSAAWVGLVRRLFAPLRVGDRVVVVADGLKVPKEGRKMPAVKKLHQESANNSKPPFIAGHSCQALALLVLGRLGGVFAVPLVSRIHEGLVFSNRDQRAVCSTSSSRSSCPSLAGWSPLWCSSLTPSTPAARSPRRCSTEDTIS